MPTANIDRPLTRPEIFRKGLRRAIGTVVDWDPKRYWGFVRLNGPVPVDFFLRGKDMPKKEADALMHGSQVVFDVAPGQPDVPKPQPRAANPRLVLPAEENFNR